MRLEFTGLWAKNHTPYRELYVIFESGMTVIKGVNMDEFSSNGSGKSTIFEILFWVITGRLLRDNSQPVSNKAKEDVQDKLELNADGVPYRIERTRKGVNSGHVDFYQGENKITAGTNTLTQELIYRTLNLSAEMLIATTLFDGSNHTSFATMGDKKQKELFVKILNLDFWEDCYEADKLELKTITDNKIMESNKYHDLSSKLKETKARFVISKTKSLAHKETKPVEKDYMPLGLKKMKTDLQLAQKDKEAASNRIELLGASEFAATQVRNDLLQVENDIKLFSTEAKSLTRELNSAEARINALNDSKCVECKQPVDVTRDQVEKATNKFLSLERKLAKVQEKLEKEEAKTKLLKTGVKSHDWEELPNLRRKLVELDFEVTTLTKSIKACDKLGQKFEVDLACYNSKLDTLLENSKELDTRGRQLYGKAVYSKTKVLEYNKVIEQREYLLKMFGRTGIQTSLIRDIQAPLNEVLADYMQIFGFKYSQIELSTFKELKNKEIRDQISVTLMEGSTKRAFTSFSRGEKRRLDLIFFLALREMLSARISTNLLILDEVINNLDPSGVSGLKQILDLKFKKSSIWIAVPTEHFEWSCQHMWTVTKKRKIACLETD